ncbi:DNA/RNA non-specific endonuclease [Candidatus Bipolaricaulota bacterium]
MKRQVALLALIGLIGLTACGYLIGPPEPACECFGGCPVGAVDLILDNVAYQVGYSDLRMNPLWVCYRVFAVPDPVSHDRPSRFKIDYRTGAQVSHDDYTNTGYDRGHMAPNAAIDYCYGRDAQLETFLMSNICPQTPALNRGVWATLEESVRDWADAFDEVWVLTGPIFDSEAQLLSAGVEVPDAFFKIVIDEVAGTLRALAFLIPQDVSGGSVPADYLTSVDEIEALAGFDFLADLDDDVEAGLEAEMPSVVWDTTDTTSRLVVTQSVESTPCDCSGPDLDCSDFATHADAQACFDYCRQRGYGDVYRLDGDSDGVACEALP